MFIVYVVLMLLISFKQQNSSQTLLQTLPNTLNSNKKPLPMSGIPQSLNAKTSSENSKSSRNFPQAYWIIYEEEVHNKSVELSDGKQVPEKQLSQLNLSNITEKPPKPPTTKKQAITQILQNISREYATHRYLNFSQQTLTKAKVQQIIQLMEKEFLKFKLTKRNLVFSILIPAVPTPLQNFISASAYFTKLIKFYHKQPTQQTSESSSRLNSPENSPRKLKMSRKASIIVGSNIFVDLRKSEEEIQQELIKLMKLDFIWLGVLSRLGTDVDKFTEAVIDEEDFTPQYVGFYSKFFQHLNQLVYQNLHNLPQSSKPTLAQLQQLLSLSSTHASLHSELINSCTQQLIRSKFNSRIILSDIVWTGDYLTLLVSRNYFNLLFIESDTLVRFKQFKAECEASFSELARILDIETFLAIDDYWYRKFVLKCLPHAKFILDRGSQSGSYSQVITSIFFINNHPDNYKQIIPPYRPTFDEYFLSICNVLKQRSGCLKEAVGSIIVKDKRIIATGYNGTPIACVNCFNGGCKVCNNSQKMNTQVLSCTCIHAQYGCILEAGIKITPGSILYSTKLPCLWCCKLIVQGQISKIVFLKSKYPHLQYENIALAKEILAKANIELVQIDETKNFISV